MSYLGAFIVSGLLITFGMCMGFILCDKQKQNKTNYDGYFVVNTKDPIKDVYRIEMYTPFGEISNKETILLKVVNEDEK